MLTDAIKGLDKIMHGDIKEGYVILVTGGPGTMKTAFTFTAMNGMLQNNKERTGIYMTLEQDFDEHRWNMKSFGIEPHPNLTVVDLVKAESMIKESIGHEIDSNEYMEFLLKALHTENNDKKPLCFALDSLNALLEFSNIDPVKKRKFVNHLFNILKRKKVVSFIIWETIENLSNEHFLVDGIIELGIDRKQRSEPTWYIAVRKMRGVRHELDEFDIISEKGGLEIVTQKC
jgi:KaiC/GvpD/RAD55 family RecA-like ATPase